MAANTRMDAHTYVFVGGLQRSGTSLFARTLAQHPCVSAFRDTGVPEDEGQFLQPVYPIDRFHGGPGRFAFDPRAHLTERSPLLTEENKARILTAWHGHWDLARPVLLAKTPADILRARFLQELAADVRFVFLTRHPVAAAIATQKWSATGIYALLHHWVVAHRILREDLPCLRHAMVLSFEDMLTDPERLFRSVEAFLGLEPHAYALRIDAAANEAYFRVWREAFLAVENRRAWAERRAAARQLRGTVRTAGLRRRLGLRQRFSGYAKDLLVGRSRQVTSAISESQDAVAMFETAVRAFGYSLLDLDRRPGAPEIRAVRG